jgi:hypothetical protein
VDAVIGNVFLRLYDHYWDSLAPQKELIMKHVRGALDSIEQEDGVRIKTYARIAELLTELERLRAENDMMRSLLIEAPTKEERDELFERRFCKGPHTESANQK